MALAMTMAKGSIEVIVRRDSAVTCSEDEYAEYISSFSRGSGDEGLLKLNGEPTRFVMRRVLPYEADLSIKNMQISIEKGQPKMNISFVIEEVRMAMTDIKNPAGAADALEFKRDSDGYASKELMQLLESGGCVMELWNARNNAKVGNLDILKKK